MRHSLMNAFPPIETENGYAVWDNIRDEIYVDDEGVSEEFTSRWQAEEYARQLNQVNPPRPVLWGGRNHPDPAVP